MRIGIDARFYGPSGKGLGRYGQKLIEGLEELDQENDYFIFLSKENFAFYQPENSKFCKILCSCPCYSWQEQIFFSFQLKKFNLDLVHFLHFNMPIFYPGKFIVTIHDLIHHLPGMQGSARTPFVYWLKKQVYKIITMKEVGKAEKIVTVSSFSQSQIVSLTPANPAKIQVVYEGADLPKEGRLGRNKDLEILENTPYLLYVGNAFPHKNLDRLLQAFKVVCSSLSGSKLNLVLVGGPDPFFLRLKKMAEGIGLNNVIFTDKISDSELSWLYQHALAYIFLSLIEGFGLPGLEAMSLDLPVICSNRGPLPEIYEDAALYFNPEDIADMAKKILRVVNSPGLRQELIKKGRKQVKKYSWRKTAQDTLKIYQSILE